MEKYSIIWLSTICKNTSNILLLQLVELEPIVFNYSVKDWNLFSWFNLLLTEATSQRWFSPSDTLFPSHGKQSKGVETAIKRKAEVHLFVFRFVINSVYILRVATGEVGHLEANMRSLFKQP